MTDDIARFAQGLQDLIYKRDKLNAELEAELARTEKLATAVASLRSLNDSSQEIIESTLFRIGAWREAPPPLPDVEDDFDFPRVARAREVANGINREVFSRPQ